MRSGMERRRYRRLPLSTPILMRGTKENMQAPFQEGMTKNLSLAGTCCTLPPGNMFEVDEVVTLSVAIPYELRNNFPFSRLAGRGRILRVEEKPNLGASDSKVRTLAIEFADNISALTAAPER